MVKKKSRIICLSISIVLTALIMLSFAVFMIGNQQQVADSAVINNADTISTDLLMTDKTNRGTSVGNPVFNGNALSALYEKLAGTGADFNAVATKARTAKSTYANNSVKSMHSGMDSGEIRTANGGKNIVVKLDGKEWIVVALTAKDTSSSSDVILTLMLKDIAYSSKWGDWTTLPNVKDFSANYPPSMYSRSYIRAGLLNGTVQHTTNGSSLTTLTSTQKNTLYGSSGYPFAIYTDNTETGNITNFLVKPNEVLYQQYENLYDVSAGKQPSTWYNAPNDSSLNDIPANKWYTSYDSTYGTSSIQTKNPPYYEWGNDLIWLPSLSETGQNSRTNVNADGGLWNLDSSQRGVSAGYCSWLRSGFTSL